MIFQASLNYIVDTFQLYAASAVAAATAVRSIFAGCFPLFAAPSMSVPFHYSPKSLVFNQLEIDHFPQLYSVP